jgi:urease accessory protein
MHHISKLLPQGQGLAKAIISRAPSLELDWDIRQKSRFYATTSESEAVGVFLPSGTVIRGGDVLLTTEGSFVRVIAAAQPVLRITACSAPDHAHAHNHGAFDLMRAAYHLGNRHVPIELKPDHLKIEPDHVLAEMLHAMHLNVEAIHSTFEPESGAYGQPNSHSSGHSHDHSTHSHA